MTRDEGMGEKVKGSPKTGWQKKVVHPLIWKRDTNGKVSETVDRVFILILLPDFPSFAHRRLTPFSCSRPSVQLLDSILSSAWLSCPLRA